MKLTVLFLTILFLSSCSSDNRNEKTNDENEDVFINQNIELPSDLKNLIINEGDTNAYYKVSNEYYESYSHPEELLLYSMIMANKYDYLQAYYDVFTCLTDVYMSDLNKMDTATANIAIEYLLKAYSKNHYQATEIVKEYSIQYDVLNNKKQIIKIFE